MSSFDYTESSTTSSSFVVEVFYNKNDQSLAVNLESDDSDKFYLYNGVPYYEYVALRDANSVGTYYNTVIKPKFGPATDLGDYNDVVENEVEVNTAPSTPKALTFNESGVTVVGNGKVIDFPEAKTTEYSLGGVYDQSVSGAPIATAEYSLQAVPDVVADSTESVSSVVYFTLNGAAGEFKSDKDNVDDAIAELSEYAGRLGLKGDVSKVTIEVTFG